jgi:hypothetical protein
VALDLEFTARLPPGMVLGALSMRNAKYIHAVILAAEIGLKRISIAA